MNFLENSMMWYMFKVYYIKGFGTTLINQNTLDARCSAKACIPCTSNRGTACCISMCYRGNRGTTCCISMW